MNLDAQRWALFYLKGQSLRSEPADYAPFAVRVVGLGFWISLDKIYYLIECGRRFIIRSMSENRTRDLPNDRSFEDRVFARFDGMEGRFDGLDTRVQALEARALDTKPIWEQALAEILEVKQGVGEVKEGVEDIKRKIDLLSLDVVQVRADQRRVDKRMDALESRPQ